MTMDSRSMTPFMAMAQGTVQEIWPGIGQIRFHRQRPGQGGAQEQGAAHSSEGSKIKIMRKAREITGTLKGRVIWKKLLTGDAPRFSAASPRELRMPPMKASTKYATKGASFQI